jgi:transposase
VTRDAGCDSQANREAIKAQQRQPVLDPKRRKTNQPSKSAQKCRWFDRRLYRERSKVERTCGWQDTDRQRVVSYDRLPEIRQGGRLLAYAMLNYRVTFSSS